jgi:predicted nucleotidyltransferase
VIVKQRTAELLASAEQYRAELSEHPILSRYWSELSLVIKGSVARGNADRYSDIDFVFFCEAKPYSEVIRMYREHGLTQRDDGVFMRLGNWMGHYHFETMDKLESYFKKPDYAQAWEYQHVIVLHDLRDRFRKLVSSLSSDLLADPLPAIKREYLDIQLTLDWLRQPLRRGDSVAVALHSAKLLQGLCRIGYLLDGKCYPHDKWLFAYLSTTRFGRRNKSYIRDYAARIAESAPRHLELDNYPQYAGGAALVEKVAAFIRRRHGRLPWIAEWYLYV